MAFVELGVAFFADKLRKPWVAVQLDADQALKVCVKQKGRLGRSVRLVNNLQGILRPFVKGVPQAAWGELSMTEPTDGSGQSTCWET